MSSYNSTDSSNKTSQEYVDSMGFYKNPQDYNIQGLARKDNADFVFVITVLYVFIFICVWICFMYFSYEMTKSSSNGLEDTTTVQIFLFFVFMVLFFLLFIKNVPFDINRFSDRILLSK